MSARADATSPFELRQIQISYQPVGDTEMILTDLVLLDLVNRPSVLMLLVQKDRL
jgi:hypothetical protein